MNDLDDIVLPLTVTDLIKLLNEVYPEKSPSLGESEKQLYFRGGQRDVVNFVNTLKERSEK